MVARVPLIKPTKPEPIKRRLNGHSTLNDKQLRFIEEFVVDHNATQAAVRAGYSSRSARQIGNSLLMKHDVAGEVVKRQKELAKNCHISAERTLKEVAQIAYAPLPEWSRSSHKLAGKIAALNTLCRHLGLIDNRTHMQVDNRSVSINVEVSADDLEQAKRLVDGTFNTPLIEHDP